MGQWFYAEGNRQQRGPLASEELIALYQSSRIAADTLVWRDGLPQWLPLSAVAEEIGLIIAPPPAEPLQAEPPVSAADPLPDPVPVPPRIPDAAPPPPGPVPPAAAYTPAPAAVPPRKGLSGCAIAAIIAGVVGVILVGILGILAAIALPTYKQYVARSTTAQAVAELEPVKLHVEHFVESNGRCPVNEDDGFQAPEQYAGTRISAVRIGRFDNGHCGIEGTLTVPGKPALDGKLIWLDYAPDEQQWLCSAEPDDNDLPLECRGG